MSRRLPSFVGIGAAKCGSTWIYRALQQHPEVYVPTAKDTYFFTRDYDRGLDWYATFFSKAGPEFKAVGEIAVGYINSRDAAQRMARDLPEVKVLAYIRNPIERALSAYQYKKRGGKATADLESRLAKHPKQLDIGLYHEHLSVYADLFPPERFRVFVLDDLRDDPRGFAESLYAFLGVERQFVYRDAGKKVLPAGKPRLRPLAAAAKKTAKWLRRTGRHNWANWWKDSFLQRVLYRPVDEKEKPALSPELKARLIDYYAEDVGRLEGMLDRDLSHWLR